ncbi:nucleotide exchange factor GrpE [Patescibacteria group bacterium]|nr:nucleotide exchange factor GrpE [Patescibacteria group bacterium]
MQKDKKEKNKRVKSEELEQKLGEYMQGWQRAQADYQNLQKETDKWKIEFVQYAKADFILELLPVYSNYKIALDHIPKEDKNKDWIKGIEHIFKQLQTLLDKFDVKEIDTVNKEFNHNLHDAIGDEYDENKEEDIILKEVQPGFMLKDKVLQVAKVIINKKSNISDAENNSTEDK